MEKAKKLFKKDMSVFSKSEEKLADETNAKKISERFKKLGY